MQTGHAAEKSRALRDMQSRSSLEQDYQMKSTPDLILGGW
jgi:hypothetical protein